MRFVDVSAGVSYTHPERFLPYEVLCMFSGKVSRFGSSLFPRQVLCGVFAVFCVLPMANGVFAADGAQVDDGIGLFVLTDKAMEGDAQAQFELGRRYLKGAGVAHDDAKALHWVRTSAEQGYARAEAGLGWMYAVGRGVKRDDGLSCIWYGRAAEQGYAVAQRMLGKCYEKGIGMEKDAAQARFWYEQAAEQGDEAAVERLKVLAVPAADEVQAEGGTVPGQ